MLPDFKKYLKGFRAYEIPSGVFLAVLQAGVYIYLNGQVATYIGSSGRSFKRTLDHKHAAREFLEASTSVLFLPCIDRHAAYELEKRLIADLKPAGNIRCRNSASRLADRLGITESRARIIANQERDRSVSIVSCESQSEVIESVEPELQEQAKR